jgi:nardilysin
VYGYTLISSAQDARHYRILSCPISGLQALVLVRPPSLSSSSSSSSSTAYVAAAVAAGSFYDPDDAPGLAHLVEHLVFLGSHNYKLSNDWEKFLARHGGASNASTQEMSTVFHFNIADQNLPEALVRFRDLLMRPVLSDSMIEKEINAVDSEFQIGRQKDLIRITEVQRFTAKKEHPFKRFCWGNAESLKVGSKLAKQAKEFHQKYYLISKIRLVVYIPGTDSWNLDSLSQVVLHCFAEEHSIERVLSPSGGAKVSGKKRKGVNFQNLSPKQMVKVVLENDEDEKMQNSDALPKLEFPVYGLPFDSEQLSFYHICPIKEKYELQVTFQLPCLNQHFKSMPTELVGEMIGHECKGSLLSLLKEEGLAHSIQAGTDYEECSRNPSFWLFYVHFSLTKKGASYLKTVFVLLFQYIRLIQNTEVAEYKRLWSELQNSFQNEFNYEEESDPIEIVEEFAIKMLNPHICPKSLLYANKLLIDFDIEVITFILNKLTPDSCRIDFLAPKDLAFDKSENWIEDPWFNIPFNNLKIPKDWITEANSSNISSKLKFCSPNTLLPRKLMIKEFSNVESDMLLLDESIDKSVRFWHKHDIKLKLPRVNVFLRLLNVSLSSDDIVRVLTNSLFSEMLGEFMNELIYSAHIGGMSLQFVSSSHPIGLELHFEGFDDRMFEYISIVLSEIGTFMDKFKNMHVKFNDAKEAWEVNLLNRNLNPSSYSYHLVHLVSIARSFDVAETLHALKAISLEDVGRHAAAFFSSLTVEGFIHGNMSADESKIAISDIAKFCQSLNPFGFIRSFPASRVVEFEQGKEVYLHFKGKNVEDNNSSIVNSYQIGSESVAMRAKLKLMESLITEACFDTLRTDQQLGYVVSCERVVMEGILSLQIHILSSEYNPSVLNQRIEEFIKTFLKELKDMDDKEYADVVEGLITDIQTDDFSLSDVGERLWQEVVDRLYTFDRLKQEVKILQNTKKSEMIAMYKTYISNPSTRRKLSVQVCSASKWPEYESYISSSSSTSSIHLKSEHEIDNFRRSRPIIPSQMVQHVALSN